MNGINALIKETPESSSLFYYMRTQNADYLWTRKTESTGQIPESAGDLILHVPGSRTASNKFLLFISYPAYGHLLQKPEWIKIENKCVLYWMKSYLVTCMRVITSPPRSPPIWLVSSHMFLLSHMDVWGSVFLQELSIHHSTSTAHHVHRSRKQPEISIVLCIIYLFLIALGFCYYAWMSSSCSQWELLSSYVAQAFHCNDLSYCRAWALEHMGSEAAAQGLWNTGSVVVAHGLSCSLACGIFPDQESNSSSALAAGF